MNKQQIKETVARILGIHRNRVDVGFTATSVACSMSVSYDNLLELATALGTTNINFEFAEGDSGYSEETPGWTAQFTLTIGVGAAA